MRQYPRSAWILILSCIAAVFALAACTPATQKSSLAVPRPTSSISGSKGRPLQAIQQPPLPSSYPTQLWATPDEQRCGNQSRKLLLTFDDSGSEAHVHRIMDELQRQNVGAAFFLVGEKYKTAKSIDAATERPIVAEMRSRGFWVGNHSWSHPNLPTLSSRQIDDQIRFGIQSNVFRAPGGSLNGQVRRLAASRGYRICGWTYDTRDWDRKPASTLVNQVLAIASTNPEALRGGVLLAHLLDSSHILEALDRIITGLRALGIELCAPQGPVGRDFPTSIC